MRLGPLLRSIRSRVGYPLGVCHMNDKRLHNLQKKYITALMNKLGLRAMYAHPVVFGPRSRGGMGCTDLRIEQGLQGLEHIIPTL